MNAVYGPYCPVHVSGPVDTTNFREFFYEAQCPGHLHGSKDKPVWAESLFDDLTKFKDCKTLEEVYSKVMQHVKDLGGKNPQLLRQSKFVESTISILRIFQRRDL